MLHDELLSLVTASTPHSRSVCLRSTKKCVSPRYDLLTFDLENQRDEYLWQFSLKSLNLVQKYRVTGKIILTLISDLENLFSNVKQFKTQRKTFSAACNSC